MQRNIPANRHDEKSVMSAGSLRIISRSVNSGTYRILNHEVRNLGCNIPPLVNAYMGLSPTMRVFGTGINYEFGDVEETGILIAVNEILEEKRIRHMDSFVKEHPEVIKSKYGGGVLKI